MGVLTSIREYGGGWKMEVFADSTVQITRGKYSWCIGTVISVYDKIALVRVDEETVVSCESDDLDVLSQ